MPNRAYPRLPSPCRSAETQASGLGYAKQSPIAVYLLNDGGEREDVEIATVGRWGDREVLVVEVPAEREGAAGEAKDVP